MLRVDTFTEGQDDVESHIGGLREKKRGHQLTKRAPAVRQAALWRCELDEVEAECCYDPPRNLAEELHRHAA